MMMAEAAETGAAAAGEGEAGLRARVELLEARVRELEAENDLLSLDNERLRKELEEQDTLVARRIMPSAAPSEVSAEDAPWRRDRDLSGQATEVGGVKAVENVFDNVSGGRNVLCVRFAPPVRRTSPLLLLGGADAHVRVLDWREGRELTAVHISAPVLAVDMAWCSGEGEPETGIVAATGMDGSVSVWRLRMQLPGAGVSLEPLGEGEKHKKYAVACRVSPDASMIVTGSRDATAHVYRVEAGEAGEAGEAVESKAVKLIHELLFNASVEAVEFVDSTTVVLAARESNVLTYVYFDNGTHGPVRRETVPVHEDAGGDTHVSFNILSLAASPRGGRFLLVGTDANTHLVFRTGTSQQLRVLASHTCDEFGNPRAVWDPSGLLIYSNSQADRALHVYDLASERIVKSLPHHTDVLRDIAVTTTVTDTETETGAEGVVVATGSYDKSVCIWR